MAVPDSELSPTLKMLVIEAQSVTTEWPNVGIILGLEYSDIETIKNDCNGKISECKLAMFNKWRNLDTSPTWEKFCDALDKSSYKALASRLRQKYVQQHVDRSESDQGQPDDVAIDISKEDAFARDFDEIELKFLDLVVDTEDSFKKISLSRLKRFCKLHYSEFPIDKSYQTRGVVYRN